MGIELFTAMGAMKAPYAQGAIQRLAIASGVSTGSYDHGTWHRLEAASGTWLGELVRWVVENHMHWRLNADGLDRPMKGDVNIREWTETTWRGGRAATGRAEAERSEVLKYMEREKITWLSDALTVDGRRIRPSLVKWAKGTVEGTEWLDGLASLKVAHVPRLLEGGRMWRGRGWWPDHLVGRAVILTCELTDEDGTRFVQRSALLVESVIPNHGKDDGIGWLTPRGIIKGRMIVTVPSNRPDKPELYGLGNSVEYPFTSDTQVAILDMDAEEAAQNRARLRLEDGLEDWYCGEYVEEKPEILRPEKMSFLKWGQLPVGWDKWHALAEAGRGVVRNAGEAELVGRKGVDKKGGGLWTGSMDRWAPSGDAPDKHGRDASTLHVYTDGGVQ